MTTLADSDPRLRVLSSRAPAKHAGYVLYWCQAFRRPTDNLALTYALQHANELDLPLLVYEAIRPDYPYASDRFHTFVLEGARHMAHALKERGIAYTFFLPKTPEEARGIVVELTKRAALVVSDDSPSFLNAHNAKAAAKAHCPYVVVDDNTPVPLSLFPKQEFAARTIRPKVHRLLPDFLKAHREVTPKASLRRGTSIELPFTPVDWKRADVGALVAACAIDHGVPAVAEFPGGADAAESRMKTFIAQKLAGYADDRNEPSLDGTSHLSPYLHFGMISARHIALSVQHVSKSKRVPGPSLDGFLEQLLVRRTLAFNFARSNARHMEYRELPEWARTTLATHGKDKRPAFVAKGALEDARSPDEVWNAAQLELMNRGIIHNYLRMLWGKLVLTWTKTPEEAHAIIVHLNDRWALDGRDPDGYTNIGWCFGLHDRPWPEHEIFGKVRTMTSRSARNKLDLDPYLQRAKQWRADWDQRSRR